MMTEAVDSVRPRTPASAPERPARSMDWEPLWLGQGGRRLYAALHPAAAALGMLVVAPLLHEQQRTRRLVTELASTLAGHGLPCLRFDFFGSGDSDGACDQLDFASIATDLDLAVRALRATAGVERVGVLVMRGAALPVCSWLERGGDADLLVVWEPLFDGPAWLAQLEEQDATERCSAERYPLSRGARAVDTDGQLMGFPVSQTMRRDIAGAALPDQDCHRSRPCWGVLRDDARAVALQLDRLFSIPPDTARIGGAASMDSTMFMTPSLQRLVALLAADLGREG